MTRPEVPKVFAEPWQAELFAITLALSDAGHFSWPTWTIAFGATLRSNGASRDLDGTADYYQAWLETLENLLNSLDIAAADDLRQIRDQWQNAYLSTPHGQPVRLPT